MLRQADDITGADWHVQFLQHLEVPNGIFDWIRGFLELQRENRTILNDQCAQETSMFIMLYNNWRLDARSERTLLCNFET